MPGGRFTIEQIWKARDKVTRPVAKMTSKIQKMTSKTSRGLDRINKKMNKFGGIAKRAAAGVAVVAALSVGAFTDIVRTGAEYEQTLISAAAKFPGMIRKGTDAFKELDEAARKYGKTTEFTATESAEGLKFLAMAGFTAADSIKALPIVLDLATASETDFASASDMATDALGAFRLASKDSAVQTKNLTRVTDVLAATANSSNTSVAQFFEAISKGGPVVASVSGDIETFAALAGTLASNSIKGGEAGTTLKNVFLGLSAATPKAKKALDLMGISVADSDGNMRDIIDIIGELNGELGKMGNVARSAVLKDIFGKIPIAGVNVLLSAGADELRRYRTELQGVSGANAALAAIMRDSVQGRLKSLGSAIEGVKLSIFDLNKGPLSDSLDMWTEWVRANEEVIATNVAAYFGKILKNIVPMIKAGKKLLPVVATIIAIIAALKAFILVMTVVNLVMDANIVAVVVIAIIALIAAIIWLTIKLRGVIEQAGGFKKIWREIADFFKENPFALLLLTLIGPAGLLVGLGLIIDRLGGFKEAWAKVSGFVTEQAELMKEALATIVDALISDIQRLFDFITSAPGKVARFFGLGDDDQETDGVRTSQREDAIGPRLLSRGDKAISYAQENFTREETVVTIKDETGRAEITSGAQVLKNLKLLNSGGF